MTSPAHAATISGRIFSCRTPLSLPPGAVVRLRLEDASPNDRVADLIADAELPAGAAAAPIAFELPYDPSLIDASHRYNVRAAILVADDLLFTSTCSHPVLTDGAPARVDIDVQPVSHAEVQMRALPLLDTRWKATEIDGAPVIPYDGAELEIALRSDDARLTGSGGCNRIVGFYALDGSELKLEMAATMMSCGESCMVQERRFIAALSAATGYRLNGDRLDLLVDGAVVARFEAA